MAKKNFYAVKVGIHPVTKEVVFDLIFKNWNETATYVQGVNKKKNGVTAEYKGFETLEEAEAYIGTPDPLINKGDGTYPMDGLHCYVDGSFNKDINNYGYGIVLVQDRNIVHAKYGAGKNQEAVSMQQIGGELSGAMNALVYAKKQGYEKVVIFHDYKGVCYHATGFWKRDNKFSEDYFQWMQNFFANNPNMEIIFCKVDAHTGDDFNEIADGLAKKSVGIEPDNIFYRMLEKYPRLDGLVTA